MAVFRSFLRIFIFSAAFCAFLTACSPLKKQFVIGVSQCSEDIWRSKLNQELLVSANYYDGVEVRFTSADDDSRKQIAQIEQFVRDRVDLLIISPNQTQVIVPAVEAAYDAGIPVILFDRKIDSDKYTAFMGADNFEIGRLLGQYIADELSGKGKIVEILGLRGSSPAADRHNGFMDAISNYPDIELVGTGYGDWLQAGGERVMRSFLEQGLTFDAVFAQNDRMARGARDAMRDPSGVSFYGIDALPGANGGLQDVISGALNASYLYPTRGDLVMELAMAILTGQPFQRENKLESALVDGHNAKLFLMQEDEISSQQEKVERVSTKLDTSLAQYNLQRLVIWLMIGFIILAAAAAALMAGSYRSMRRLNAELEERNVRLQEMSLQLEKSVATKLDFFTSVSHDLRTPLALVSGPLDHVMNGSVSPEQRQFLSIARRNVDILLRLVGNILDFRKIESGKMQLKLSRFDLVAAVKEWMSGFNEVAASRTFLYDGPESLTIEADMHLTERALFNLLSNAFKFTPEGGSVFVTLAASGKDVLIQVRDSGIGIPEDKLAKIFEQFYQVSDASSGTGIGLALVRSIAELHGGSVKVTSKLGEGCLFSIRLPMSHPEVEVSTLPQAADALTEQYDQTYSAALEQHETLMDQMSLDADNQPTLLIIDDNEDIRTYLRSILSGSFRVLSAASGEEGLQKATREQPDLVISDVMMPGMDGLECCRRLKGQLATSHIPVILLTAKSLDEQRAEGYESGADAYLTKPFSEAVLLSRINNLIKSRIQLKDHYLETGEGLSSEKENDFLSKFRNIVQQNLSESELNIEQIADEIGLSRVQLYRKVKSLTGYSPLEVIRILRLKAADRLLKTSDMTVSEIAYQVGFGTPSYFSKCYRDFFGRSPNSDR